VRRARPPRSGAGLLAAQPAGTLSVRERSTRESRRMTRGGRGAPDPGQAAAFSERPQCLGERLHIDLGERSHVVDHGKATTRVSLSTRRRGSHPPTASAPGIERRGPAAFLRNRASPVASFVSSLRIMVVIMPTRPRSGPTLGLRGDVTKLRHLAPGSGRTVPPMNPSLRPGRRR
jgi:hypothetical protein